MIFDYSTYSNLIIIGDIHGRLPMIIKQMSEHSDTLFISTGDCHLGEQTFDSDIEMFEKIEYSLSINNNVLVLIRGNHDNPKYFKKASTFRTLLGETAPHVLLVPDYSIIKTSQFNILCIGGARSIDRVFKIKDKDWWQNENIQRPDDNFFEETNDIDIIISHSAPLFAQPLEFSDELKFYNSFIVNAYAIYDYKMKNDIYKERLLLKGIYEKLNNKHHIQYILFGHYHKSIESKYNKTKCISLSVGEFKSLTN